MNEKPDVHIFVWRARHTICTSFFSFIPQGNEQNQQSSLKYYASNTGRHVFCIENRFSIVLKYFIYHFLLQRTVLMLPKTAHSALLNKIINKTFLFFFLFWVLRSVKIISFILSRVNRKEGETGDPREKP